MATPTKPVDPSAGRYAALEAAGKAAAKKGILLDTSGTKKVVTKLPVAKKPVAKPAAKAAPKPIAKVVPMATPIAAPAPEEPIVGDPWTLEGDPLYSAAMDAGKSKFNYAQAAALAEKQTAQIGANQSRKQLDVNAEENRRRLAGNYAARNMAGGAGGALILAEARANAEQITARTSIQDQITALDRQYLSNFGAVGTDWTGTAMGQQYKTDAAQQAISAQLAKYGVA